MKATEMKNIFRRPLRRRVMMWVIAPAIAVGISAPVVAMAIVDTHRPTGPPAASSGTAPSITNPVAPWMLALSNVIASSPGGALPNGCATMVGYRLCVPQVTVDGSRVSDVALLESMLSVATRPRGLALPDVASVIATLQNPATQQQAITSVVASELQYRAGLKITSGTLPMAQSMAQQQLQNYLADPAAGKAAGIVPAGSTPQQFFLSPTMIASYQRELTIGHQQSVMAAGGIDPATWVRQQLVGHQIRVNGAPPAFALAGAVSLP
jgi:hypothetical protein